ncbi:MAG: nitrogen regulation protein NR(II) [Gammaproteobacteria bacterium]|nr:nitrogen regulation protein NR(II) [Gammaproteobacteria bacterium]
MNDTSKSLNDCRKRILDNLSTVVLLFDQNLRLLYMNQASEIMFGVSARHMLGMEAGSMIQCPGGQLDAKLIQALTTGHPITEREVPVSLPHNQTITVDCAVIPFSRRVGESGLLIEIQQIDRHLRISREEHLLTQHQATRDLVRGLAHEIKNPLGGLRGAAQLLEAELPDPSLREYTQIIIDEADRLQTLLDRMLGPNKLPKLAEVNIHTLLERVRQLVLAESGSRVEIARDYDPSIPDLYLDSDRIIQALLNIVRNGAQALSKGSRGRILLRTRILRQFTIGHHRHKLVAQIDVEDNGPGIPEAIREKLFYPMVKASEEGQGLGLSISQFLINLHGGLVECQSRQGCTTFSVLLPVENPNAQK